jgi:hypothetical protein
MYAVQTMLALSLSNFITLPPFELASIKNHQPATCALSAVADLQVFFRYSSQPSPKLFLRQLFSSGVAGTGDGQEDRRQGNGERDAEEAEDAPEVGRGQERAAAAA